MDRSSAVPPGGTPSALDRFRPTGDRLAVRGRYLLCRAAPAPPPVLRRAAPPDSSARPGSERGPGSGRRPAARVAPGRQRGPGPAAAGRQGATTAAHRRRPAVAGPGQRTRARHGGASPGRPSGGPARRGPDRRAQLLRPGQPARRARGAAVRRGGDGTAGQPLSGDDTTGAAAAAGHRLGTRLPSSNSRSPSATWLIPWPEPFPRRCLLAAGCRRPSPPASRPRRPRSMTSRAALRDALADTPPR